jgi:hypothetical protein
MIGNETLSLGEYVKDGDLADVATSGQYGDIMGVPNLSEYMKVTDLNNQLSSEYYKKPEVEGEIARQIGMFKEGALQGEFASQLSEYETGNERDEKVTQVLQGYDTKSEAGAKYIDDGELAGALSEYAKEEKIRGEILSEYIKSEMVSAVGKSGAYDDIIDKPELVLKSEYELNKSDAEGRYSTKSEVDEKVEAKGESVRSGVLLKVSEDYVSKVQLASESYARQESVDALKEVARSGQYSDLEGAPDLSSNMLSEDIASGYVDK